MEDMNAEVVQAPSKSVVDTHPSMPWRNDLGRIAATESPTHHPSVLQKVGTALALGPILAGGIAAEAAKANTQLIHEPTIDTQTVDQSQATQNILKQRAEFAANFQTVEQAAGSAIHYYEGFNLVGIPQGVNVSQLPDAFRGMYYTLAPDGNGYQQVLLKDFQYGVGYWKYFSSDTSLPIPQMQGPQNPVTLQIPPGQYTMVSNEFLAKADITGADVAYVFDPQTNQYQAVTELQPGQGAWTYSANGGILTISPEVSNSPAAPPETSLQQLENRYTWTTNSKDANGNSLSPSEFLRSRGKIYIPEGQWQNVFQETDNETAWQLQQDAANQGRYQILFPVVADDLDKIEWIERAWVQNPNDGQVYGYLYIRARDGAGQLHLRGPFADPDSGEKANYRPTTNNPLVLASASQFSTVDFELQNAPGKDQFLGNTSDGKVISTEYQFSPTSTVNLPTDGLSYPTDSNIIIANVPVGARLQLNQFGQAGQKLAYPDYDVVVYRGIPSFDPRSITTPGSNYSLYVENQGKILATTMNVSAK